SACPPLDLVLVPGGGGTNPLLEDAEVLGFLRRVAATARYVVGVCTGSLVLGAAGLLRGRRAATHWMSRDLLRSFGAEPVAERVVADGDLFTGGGVTAGIDVALTVAAEIAGRVGIARGAAAERIELSSFGSNPAPTTAMPSFTPVFSSNPATMRPPSSRASHCRSESDGARSVRKSARYSRLTRA